MLGFGGWITLLSLIEPFFLNLDRVFVAIHVNEIELGYYNTTQDLIIQTVSITITVIVVLYPYLVTKLKYENNEAIKLLRKIILSSLFILFIFYINLFFIGDDFLIFWINKEFNENSYAILMIFGIGIIIKCVLVIPLTYYTFALNKPDILPKILVFLLIPYTLSLNYIAPIYGINGFAYIWSIEKLCEGICLILFMRGHISEMYFFRNLKNKYKELIMIIMLIFVLQIADIMEISFVIKFSVASIFSAIIIFWTLNNHYKNEPII